MAQTTPEPTVTPPIAAPAGKTWSAVRDAGAAADKGTRRRMEDAHTLVDSFAESPASAFFGVFDGHGGKAVADACAASFHVVLASHLTKIPENEFTSEKGQEIFTTVYAEVDESLKSSVPTAGACAVTAFIRKVGEKRWLFVANAGDSRAILSRTSGVERLTVDHKPTREEEGKRIIATGGFLRDDRVNGMLGVTRALGDHCMKDWIISKPHVTAVELAETDDLLVLACDGVWDVIEDDAAIAFLKEQNEENTTILAKALAVKALKGGSQDNISVIVVRL